jgi:TP901 family phage tail tape measure protein
MAIDRKLNVIVGVVDKYSKAFDNIRGGLTSIGKLAMAGEAAVLALSTVAALLAVKMGGSVVQSAAEFHDAIFDIEAVAASFGTTSQEIGDILDTLVAKFPLTGKEAGEAMQLIAQMGYGAEEQLLAVSDAAITLSIATSSDLQTAAAATMATMNSFGMSIEETDRVINTFAAAAFTSAAGTEELREAMKYAAPVAALAGQNFEQTVAAVSKLVDKGLEASTAGTNLRMALAQLAKGTDTTTAALAKYGLTLDDVNPQTHSLSEIIGAFGGQTISAGDAIAIFGVRAATLATIINEGQAAFDYYTESITGTSAAIDAAATKSQKWEVVMNNLGGTTDVFKKTIGEDLVPLILDLVGRDEKSGIRGVITKMMELEKVTGGIGGPMVSTFSSIVDNVKGMAGSFDDGEGSIRGFYNILADVSSILSGNVELISIYATEFGGMFAEASEEGTAVQTVLTVINTAMGAMALSVAAAHDSLAGLINLGKVGFETLKLVVGEFGAFVLDSFSRILQAADYLPFVDLEGEIESLNGTIQMFDDMAAEAFQNVDYVENWTDKVVQAIAKADEAIKGISAENAAAELEKVRESIETLTAEEKNIRLALEKAETDEEIASLKKRLDEVTEKKDILIGIQADDSTVVGVQAILQDLEKKETELKLSLATAETKEEIRALSAELDKVAEDRKAAFFAMVDATHKENAQKQIDELTEKQREIKIAISKAQTDEEIESLQAKLDSIENLKEIVLSTEVENREELAELQAELQEITARENEVRVKLKSSETNDEERERLKAELAEITGEKAVIFKAMADKDSIYKVSQEIDAELEETYVEIEITADGSKIKKVGQDTYKLFGDQWLPVEVKVDSEKVLKSAEEVVTDLQKIWDLEDKIKAVELEIETEKARANIDEINAALGEVQGQINHLEDRRAEIQLKLMAGEGGQELYEEFEEIGRQIENLEEEKQILITADSEGANQRISELNKELDKLVDQKYETAVTVEYDEEAAQAALENFRTELVQNEEGMWVETYVRIDGDQAEQDAAAVAERMKKKMEEESELELSLKKEKFESDLRIVEENVRHMNEMEELNLELRAEFDIERMKQSVNMYEAQTDRIRAASEEMRATMDSLGQSIATAGDTLSSMFGTFASTDFEDMSDKWFMEDLMERQMALQEKIAAKQMEVADAQIEKLNTQTELMKADELRPIAVSIEGDAEGWLRGLVQSLMEDIFAKAEAEAFSCFGSEF